MDGLDCAKCQKSIKKDTNGIIGMFNEYDKKKCNSVIFSNLKTKQAEGWWGGGGGGAAASGFVF